MSVDAKKIKVGDKIRLRNGEVRTVTNVDLRECSTYPVDVCLERVMIYTYTRDGFYWKDLGDDKDIVEIIPVETSEEKPNGEKVNLFEAPAKDEMTMRDHFAMAAMSALLQEASTKAAEESIGKDAYFFADKMMKARKENN